MFSPADTSYLRPSSPLTYAQCQSLQARSLPARSTHVATTASTLIALAVLIVLTTVAHANTSGETIVGVHIVSHATGSEKIADAAPKRELAEVGVTLYAVLETKRGAKRVFYGDTPDRIRVRGRVRQVLPMDQAPSATLAWYKVEPTIETMSNEASGSFRFEKIEYREVIVSDWVRKTTVQANVRPTLTPYRGDDRGGEWENGIGTMRYKLVARTVRGNVASPGIEARRKTSSGGLTDRVHRISLRRDDTFLGLMTEMYGQPYIWASGGSSDRKHQSERLEGSDCADLMVYGIRRLGYKVPYTWTGGLHEYTRSLGKGTIDEARVYVDKKGNPLPFTRVGDLILFPRHVGALVEDRGVKGVLDAEDIMMHTLFASPREQPIGDTSYAETPVELLRWKKR